MSDAAIDGWPEHWTHTQRVFAACYTKWVEDEAMRKIRGALAVDDVWGEPPATRFSLAEYPGPSFFVPIDRLEEAMATGMFVDPTDKRNRHERRKAKALQRFNDT